MGHGGRRAGAGRPKGCVSKISADIKLLAQNYGPDAIAELARIMKTSRFEQVRVAAIKELLDRGYGRPPQESTLIIEKRDAADWTRAELVAFLNDARTRRDGTAEADGSVGGPDSVH